MVLYIVSVGLSLTMGLMGFVNLAHGAFAMAGGYVTVTLMNSWHMSFGLALLAAFIVVALVSAVLERTLYTRLYGAGELEQVLFTIGLVFMAGALMRELFGPLPILADASRPRCSAASSISASAPCRCIALASHWREFRADRWRYGLASIALISARDYCPPSTTGAWRSRAASTPPNCSP